MAAEQTSDSAAERQELGARPSLLVNWLEGVRMRVVRRGCEGGGRELGRNEGGGEGVNKERGDGGEGGIVSCIIKESSIGGG